MNLITGGAGVTGIALANKFITLGEKIRILDCRQPTLTDKSMEFIQGDFRDSKTVETACKNIDIVFHLGALQPAGSGQTRLKHKKEIYYETNVIGTQNILNSAAKANVRKIVYLSSSIVYGIPETTLFYETSTPSPIGEYGKSKLKAEELCLEFYAKKRLDVTILRPRTIVGSGRLGLFWILFNWIRQNRNIYIIGSGNNRFQFVHLDDIIDACILCQTKGSGEILNLGAKNVDSVYNELTKLIRYAKSNSKIIRFNPAVMKCLLKTFNLFAMSPLVEEHYLVADKTFILDTSKAEKLLGWTPKYSNLDSLIHAYDWFIQNRGKIQPEFEGILKLIKFFS